MRLHVRSIALAAMAALGLGVAAPPVSAEVIKLTIASSHPTTVPWVGVMHSHVVPEANRRLKAMGSKHSIKWTEAYGGTLYKFKNTLEAVENGVTDIGWVGTLWEPSKMPLQNITYNTPFVTDDLPGLMKIMNRLHKTVPALNKAWTKRNQVLLGVSGAETYHIVSKFPITKLADLKGRKILAPGPAANWLKGTGAVAVNGALPTYYTQLKTGVAEGCIVILTGAYPFRLHEVAPYITKVGIGASLTGGLSINKDT